LEAAIEKVLAACRTAKVPCGIFDSKVAMRTQQGFQFMAVGIDGGVSVNVQESLRQRDEFQSK
jgi:hypothetical protein